MFLCLWCVILRNIFCLLFVFFVFGLLNFFDLVFIGIIFFCEMCIGIGSLFLFICCFGVFLIVLGCCLLFFVFFGDCCKLVIFFICMLIWFVLEEFCIWCGEFFSVVVFILLFGVLFLGGFCEWLVDCEVLLLVWRWVVGVFGGEMIVVNDFWNFNFDNCFWWFW